MSARALPVEASIISSCVSNGPNMSRTASKLPVVAVVASNSDTTITALIHHPTPFHLSTRHVILFTAEMADQMDVDAVKGEQQEEKVGPAPDLPAERSTWFAFIHLHLPCST